MAVALNAFSSSKLNDIERIEMAVALLDSEATVPAHIWLKYLKIILVVTQTPEERKVFEEKCANALKYQYSKIEPFELELTYL